MGFELVQKRAPSVPLESDEVAVNTRGVVLNSELSKKFAEKGYCEVYLDYESKRVGLKPSADNVKGYTVNGEEILSIIGSFVKKLPRGRFKVKYVNGMYSFTVDSFLVE